MKHIINKIVAGAFMLLTTAGIISCTDINEWETDSQYDRLFSPGSFSVSATTTTAEVTWKATPGTNYYIIEVSTDSLYGKTEECRENSIVYGTNKDIKKPPYTLEDLNSNTKYYIRIMGCSETKGNSHWNYLEKFSFQTKSENIFETVGSKDKGEDFITLRWDATLAVTHLEYAQVTGIDENGNSILGEIKTIDLSNAEGFVKITELQASTSYQFTIYNGTHPRGTRIVSTTNPTPSANVKKYLYQGDALTQEDINALASAGSVTYIMEAGMELVWETLDETTGEMAAIVIPDGLSVTFFGASGGEKPTIKSNKTIEIDGNHNYISFENVAFINTGSTYLINEGNTSSLETLSFTDCTFDDYSRSIIRLKDNASISIDNLIIDNCVITNQGSDNYACFYWNNAAYSIANFIMSNTTVNTALHNVMDFRSSNTTNIEIENCTFYNVIGASRYFLDCQNIAPTIKLTNLIFAKANTAVLAEGVWTSTSRGVRANSTPTISGVYFTADFVFGSNAFKPTYEYNNTSENLFTDPENGNFTIKDSSFDGKNSAGDPRWYMSAE